jgi:predicted GIY-YIG superfamily endonuclease
MNLTRKERQHKRQLALRAKCFTALRYTVYLIKTFTPNFYYVGWASNHEARWEKHRKGTGAKFTKKHGVAECSILCKTNQMNEAERREKKYVVLLQHENPMWVVSMGMPLSHALKTATVAYYNQTS